MKNNYNKIFILGSLLAFVACTDLEVVEKDSVVIETESGSFGGIDPAAGLTSAYAGLRGFSGENNMYALADVTSDELLVPTRGTDWGDNGIWRTLHQHTWDASHEYILNSWNTLNSNIFQLNQLLAPESQANAQQTAEGKFLRAYNMYFVLDFFGQVPYREVNEGVDVDPRVLSSQEAFDFIVKDLTEALEGLPPGVPNSNESNFKASKASANFMLAKTYLNKHVYLKTAPDPADMTKVIQHVDAITADGYALHDGYFDIFKSTPDSETILWTDGSVGNKIWNGLHYNQQTPDNAGGGWNGFSTTADFYALFEGSQDSNEPGNGQEERRGFVPTSMIGYGFLVGQQYNNEQALLDRAGNPLIFTKEYPGLAGNNERNGIRIIKYHPTENPGGSFVSHYILLRYADAFLMKIEAILRGGSSGEDALALYNQLRTIRGATPAAAITLDDILDERGRELYIEGWRRNDQIRFGTFTSTWPMKENTEEFRVLFPIPANALSSNPNLIQNPGY